MNGGAALLLQMTSKRNVGGRNGRFFHSRHQGGFNSTDRPYSNRVGFVNELWFSKLGDVRPKPRTTTNCGRIWYNRVSAGTNQGASP